MKLDIDVVVRLLASCYACYIDTGAAHATSASAAATSHSFDDHECDQNAITLLRQYRSKNKSDPNFWPCLLQMRCQRCSAVVLFLVGPL